MAFFDKVDKLGIAENHIQRLQSLEQKEAAAILKKYSEIRRDLRDRLETVRADSFTAQQLRGILIQVETSINQQSRILRDGITGSVEKVAVRGIEDLIREVETFSEEFDTPLIPLNVNALAVATDVRNLVASRYESSVDAYAADQKARVASYLTNALIEQKSLGEVVTGLSQYQLGEEWKVLRLARTELHNIYGLGKMKGMTTTRDQLLPDLMKALVHPMDARTGLDSVYLAKLNPVLPLDEPFEYRWGGKLRRFMSPPDRPNDRGILIPYVPHWGPAKGDSGIDMGE